MKPRRQKGFLSSQPKSLFSLFFVHGRSLRRCSSERTHPQRSPLGRCLGAPKWQMDFCKLPNQITRIILAERSNLTFTRSGAAASSLGLSHFRDFGGGRLSCDFEEENENFSEYSTVSKTTNSKTVIRIFYETVEIKGLLPCQQKFLLSSFLVPTLRIPGFMTDAIVPKLPLLPL